MGMTVLSNHVPVFVGVLRDHRRALLLWMLAMAIVPPLYISFWPMMDENMVAAIEGMPEAFVKGIGYDHIMSAAGYISSTVYGLVGPGILLVYAIAFGARWIAGQEEDGTLELELASPVDRRRLYAERLAALWTATTLLVTVVALTTLATAAVFKMGVSTSNILAGSAGFLGFLLAIGTITYAVGAVTGRRAAAMAGGAAVAVVSFMLHATGSGVDIEWMLQASPFSWYLANDPLLTGFDVPGLLRLSALTLVAAVVGGIGFLRRDLMV